MQGPDRPDYFHAPLQERVYNYWLGGKDNYDVDRRAADEMSEGCPGLRVMARENRRFILDAVEWVARNRGIRQFLDLGCGLPPRPSVHQAARDVIPDAAVVYVDRDPVAVLNTAALEARGHGLGVLEADVRDTGAVLGSGEVREVIDLAQPACAVLGTTLSYMDAAEAGAAVTGYAGALAPGSAVVISCVSFADEALAGRISGMFSADGAWQNHRLRDVEGFFAGLQVMRAHPADCRRSPLLLPGSGKGLALLGGIGVRP